MRSSDDVIAFEGYKSIGSFHSDDIEMLQRLPAADYTPPAVPFCTEAVDAAIATLADAGAPPTFGHGLKSEFFLLDSQWTFVNHGAFGGVLRPGFDTAVAWQAYAETQPLRFFDRVLLPHLTHSLRVIAEFVNADPADMASVSHVAMI